ncbi:hypothetical protein ABTM80_19580, partial [Acinetobacter baumannii]
MRKVPPAGRARAFASKLAVRICERIAGGESLRAICRDDGFPARATVFRWLAEHPTFAEHYARAR